MQYFPEHFNKILNIIPEVYSERRQRFMMDFFEKTVNGRNMLTIFAKSFTLDVAVH